MKRSLFRMVATTGNQSLYTTAQPVYSTTTDKLLPAVGQPVLWVPNENISIAAGDLATLGDRKACLSVVYKGADGKKKLVDVNGSDWDLCKDKFRITNTLPQCSVNQKVDQFFDCVTPDTGYSIEIVYQDAYIQALEGGEGRRCYQFNYAPKLNSDCGTCDTPTLSCYTVACGLADEINRYNDTKELEQVGRVNTGGQVYFPIKAVALPYGKKFHKICLSPGNSTCASCDTLSGLVSLTLHTNEYTNSADVVVPAADVVISLSQFNVADVTDPELMLTEIAEYLNTEMKAIGAFVNISGGTGKCCQYEIEVGGCFDTATLTTEAGATLLTEEDPWMSYPQSTRCKPCEDAAPADYSPTCLIRYYTESILAKCSCLNLPGDNLNFRNFYKQIIDIHPLEGWNVDKFVINEVQDQVYPKNLGYYFLTDLPKQAMGGRGADLWQGGEYYGMYPQEMTNHKFFDSKFNIKCEAAYCSINLVARKGSEDWPIQNSQASTVEHETLMLIPTTDPGTFASLKTIWDALAALSACNVITDGCFEVATSASISGCLVGTPLVAGLTRQLTASVLPVTAPQTGTWTTSNAAFATVSSTGLVTGVANGDVTITFTASTGVSITATCVINVDAA